MGFNKYKVIALSVGGLNNKIFNSGDIVSEDNFYEGRADALVEAGFLEKVGKNSKIKVENKAIAAIDEFDITDLYANLKNNGIEYPLNATKEELYKLYCEVLNPV